MDNKISTQARAELVRVLGQRYRKSSKMAKTQILDEFIAVRDITANMQSAFFLVKLTIAAIGAIRVKFATVDESTMKP